MGVKKLRLQTRVSFKRLVFVPVVVAVATAVAVAAAVAVGGVVVGGGVDDVHVVGALGEVYD